MNNKSERAVETDSGIFHDAAGPEVMNEMLMDDSVLSMVSDTFAKYII